MILYDTFFLYSGSAGVRNPIGKRSLRHHHSEHPGGTSTRSGTVHSRGTLYAGSPTSPRLHRLSTDCRRCSTSDGSRSSRSLRIRLRPRFVYVAVWHSSGSCPRLVFIRLIEVKIYFSCIALYIFQSINLTISIVT